MENKRNTRKEKLKQLETKLYKVFVIMIFTIILLLVIKFTLVNKESNQDPKFVLNYQIKEEGNYNQFSRVGSELFITSRIGDYDLFYYDSHDLSTKFKWSDRYHDGVDEELNLIMDGGDLYGVWFNYYGNYHKSYIMFKKLGSESKIISNESVSSIAPVFIKHSEGDYFVIYSDMIGNIWQTISLNKGINWSEPYLITNLNSNNSKEVGAFELNKDIFVYAPNGDGIYELVYDYENKSWMTPIKIIDRTEEYGDIDLKATYDDRGIAWLVWDPTYSNSKVFWANNNNNSWKVNGQKIDAYQDGDIEVLNNVLMFITENKIYFLEE